jgi:hypothetical protein
MAAILLPQGSLSCPCEKTTVLSVMIAPLPLEG